LRVRPVLLISSNVPDRVSRALFAWRSTAYRDELHVHRARQSIVPLLSRHFSQKQATTARLSMYRRLLIKSIVKSRRFPGRKKTVHAKTQRMQRRQERWDWTL